MPRPREFDIDEVLREVMELFWEKGYRATSFADLERATGIKKASLVTAYGDKAALFRKALECYHSERAAAVEEILAGGRSPRESIRDWLLTGCGCCKARTVEKKSKRSTSREPEHSGCFVMNTAMHAEELDDSCLDVLEAFRRDVEAELLRVVKDGIRTAQFRRNLDARLATRYLIAASAGMQVAVKFSRSRREIEGIVELILCGLR